jgi:hypothetical protein
MSWCHHWFPPVLSRPSPNASPTPSVVSDAKTEPVSNRNTASIARLPPRHSSSSNSEIRNQRKIKMKKSPPKWVQLEEDARRKVTYPKPPPRPDQAMPMTDVGLNHDGVPKNMGNLWLADLGASCHMTFSEEWMYDCKEVCVPIKIGNGKSMGVTKLERRK